MQTMRRGKGASRDGAWMPTSVVVFTLPPRSLDASSTSRSTPHVSTSRDLYQAVPRDAVLHVVFHLDARGASGGIRKGFRVLVRNTQPISGCPESPCNVNGFYVYEIRNGPRVVSFALTRSME